jgi:FkbM family methyltransferase
MISKTRNRLRRLARATRYGISGAFEDFKLLSRHANGGCALRYSRMDGFDLLVRADEDLGRDIYFFREYEPWDSSFILGKLRPTDICLDVGANVGFYTISLAMKVREGEVHAFEPAELNYHVLALNTLTNPLSNVVVNNCAVGDRNQEVDFFVAQDGGFSSTVDTGRRRIVERTRVRMVTLDSYCSEVGLSRVDFLKVDVEGGEPMVIRGAHELLSDHKRKPRLVMLELYEPMLCKFGAGIRDVVELMKGYGYAPSICVADDLVPFAEQDCDTFNVFFTEK